MMSDDSDINISCGCGGCGCLLGILVHVLLTLSIIGFWSWLKA